MSSPSPIVHIVDDDEFVRTALGNLLSAAGYEVRTYSSGTEFLLSAPKDKLRVHRARRAHAWTQWPGPARDSDAER